jgi:hypothetical protein
MSSTRTEKATFSHQRLVRDVGSCKKSGMNGKKLRSRQLPCSSGHWDLLTHSFKSSDSSKSILIVKAVWLPGNGMSGMSGMSGRSGMSAPGKARKSISIGSGGGRMSSSTSLHN